MAFMGLLTLLLVSISGCSGAGPGPLTSAEIEDIKVAARAYGTAWLSNDPEAVMATMTGNAVMVPSGMSPLEGEKAIRAFWWPEDSPSTTVTQFTTTEQEAGGYGDFGFVRGSFTLGFEYGGATYSSGGTYLCLLQRLADGSWLISHRMWSDGPSPTE
jgi:ketosteroid isomerase-like protein